MLQKRREEGRRQWRWETEKMDILRKNKPTGFILYYYRNETGAQQKSVRSITRRSQVRILLALGAQKSKTGPGSRRGKKIRKYSILFLNNSSTRQSWASVSSSVRSTFLQMCYTAPMLQEFGEKEKKCLLVSRASAEGGFVTFPGW